MSLADHQENQTFAETLGSFFEAPKLYESLGEFICYYAKVEQTCHLLFDVMSGLPREVSRAIVGGSTRLTDLLSPLTRIIDLSTIEGERKREYHSCIDQLNKITALRHRLIHRGASISGEEIRSSNELVARSREAIEILRLHVNALRAASRDCFRMEIRLLYVAFPDMKERLGDELASKTFAPWQYKPVQPDMPHRVARKARHSKRLK